MTMEHICSNCEHWRKNDRVDFFRPDPETGDCVMLKQVRQASGDMPQDGFDTAGKEITNAYQEYGVRVHAGFGKDCEYYSSKKNT